MRKVQEQGKPKKKDGVLEKLLYFDKPFFTGEKAPYHAHFFVARQSRAHIRIFISHSSHSRHAQRLPQAPGVGRRISGSRKISLIFRDIFIREKPAAGFSSFATKMSRAERAPRTDFYSDRRKPTRRPPRRVCVVNIHKNIHFFFFRKGSVRSRSPCTYDAVQPGLHPAKVQTSVQNRRVQKRLVYK